MKQNRYLTCSKMCLTALMATGALFLASCAKDGFDEETFQSSVKGTALTSPAATDITISPSADGKSQTISWPVVKGAGGYYFSFYETDNMDTPIVADSLVDGCSVTVKREEDVNYQLSLRTAGNAQYNNTDAAEATVYAFNTFAEPYAVIPTGTDLYQYFIDNPLPEVEEGEKLYIDLAPGGSYTLSDVIDFSNHNIVLRTTSKTDYATITYGENGSIEYCGGFTLKYLHFDCTASGKTVLAFSATPVESILDAANGNHYQITEPTAIQNCTFEGVKHTLYFDNKVKYCLKTFFMENCLIHLESEAMTNDAVFQLYDGGGFINDFTMDNSTIWNTGESDQKYFIRYSNAGRCDRAGYTTNSINLHNCTFYNIAYKGQMANHSGFDGRATSNYDITNNIFVDCGGGAVPRRLIGRLNESSVTTFANNTYWYNGAAELEGAPVTVEGAKDEYDKSGSALQTDPAFVDAANANFTPTGAEQLQYQTGDPRWLP